MLERFLDDSSVPLKVGDLTVSRIQGRTFFREFLGDMEKSFSNENESSTEEAQRELVWNINEGQAKDTSHESDGIGRFISTNYALTTVIEARSTRI